MKSLITLLSLVFVVTIANAQEFKFKTESINYGKITKGSDGIKTFEFTNVGDAPLIIKNVFSTCGCAVPKKPEKPIMPGAKGEIKVSYNTNIVGGFSKMFTIISNAKKERKTVKIKGFVVNNSLASK